MGMSVASNAVWLAASELAAHAADELADLRGRAWAAAYPEPVSVIEIGPCPEVFDGTVCPGTVAARMRPADSLLTSRVVCSHDVGHEWTPDRWRALGRDLGRVWDTHVAPDVVAAAYQIPVADVYRLASVHRWKTIKEGRRVRYCAQDVATCLG
jgi:hypothetical protein